MATPKYIFTVSNGQLLVELNNVSLDFDGDESKTCKSPTLDLFKDTIRLLDFGIFVKSFKIENIETINLVVPTDIKDAFDLLLALLPNGYSSATTTHTQLTYTSSPIFTIPQNSQIISVVINQLRHLKSTKYTYNPLLATNNFEITDPTFLLDWEAGTEIEIVTQ